MKNNTGRIIGVIIAGLLIWWGVSKFGPKKSGEGASKIIHAEIGTIQSTVSTTGTVLPKNRLEVKPPVNGRVEQMLVKEGQSVKAGNIIAWMSSTDRAALLDAARGQGEDKLKYWQEVYKPIPLIAPIDGQVIVGTTQPGQAITTVDPVIVLSDRLIVRAQVDETDIGKIKEGQKAMVSLDAYPDTKLNAVVDHIYYESKTVNNVTTYEVDLVSETVPEFFRSGMNANIEFIQESKPNVLVLPVTAVQKSEGKSFVLVRPKNGGNPVRQPIEVGISDDKNIEVVSGLTKDDDVVIRSRRYSPPQQGSGGTNPFMPQRRKQ